MSWAKLAVALGLAVSTGSFYPLPTKEAIVRIHELGFSLVEITVQDSELNYDFHRRTDLLHFRELATQVHELGLSVISVHAPFLSGVAAFSSKTRGEILLRSMEITSMLGGDEMVVHPYHVFRTYERACSFLLQNTQQPSGFTLPEFSSVLKRARDLGVRIGIENIAHWSDFPLLNDPRNMLKLVSGFASDWVKVDLDIFHSAFSGRTLDFLNLLRENIISLHLSNITDRQDRTLPGKGRVDWAELAGHIGRLPNLDHLVMEVAGQFEDEELGNSAGYLRGAFGLEP